LGLPFSLLSKIFRLSYQIIIPANTYAPWLNDKNFQQLFKHVKKHSLVNKYQAWELWNQVENCVKVDGDILEVGVWRGSTSIIMGQKLQQLGSDKTIYACDTFEGVVKAGDAHDNYYKGGEHNDTSLDFVKSQVAKFNLQNVQLLKGIFPEDTGGQIGEKKFSLCHIDVDAYQSGKEVFEWVWPRLNVGGTILFNDYGFPLTRGITRLVNEQYARRDCLVMHNLNGNGIIIKIK
jgi:O-methyltransferase